jgi:hypothetical protein
MQFLQQHSWNNVPDAVYLQVLAKKFQNSKWIPWKKNFIHVEINGFNMSTKFKITDFLNKFQNITQKEDRFGYPLQ